MVLAVACGKRRSATPASKINKLEGPVEPGTYLALSNERAIKIGISLAFSEDRARKIGTYLALCEDRARKIGTYLAFCEDRARKIGISLAFSEDRAIKTGTAHPASRLRRGITTITLSSIDKAYRNERNSCTNEI